MSSDTNKIFIGFIMRRIETSFQQLAAGDPNGALMTMYNLIPFLDPPIQEKMEPIEKQIEAMWLKVRGKVGPGSEYGQVEELYSRMQNASARMVRETQRQIMVELHIAGYFESEKGIWFDPSKGAKKEDDWRSKRLV